MKIRIALMLSLFILANSAAFAHHILGIPHYSYDESYPQTPILTYRVESGPYEIKMTGFPGRPQPGESCSFYVYVKELSTAKSFDGTVTMTVFRDRMIGEDPIVYGPIGVELEEAVYKFYPRFEEEGNYTARIEFSSQGVPWTLDLPVMAGEPGSPWKLLGGTLAGVILFLVVIRAVKIKMERKRGIEASDESKDIPQAFES